MSSQAGDRGRRRAAGIYGTIVTAAVIAAAGTQLGTAALAVTIVVTLFIYWLAEEYAELLGEETHAGRLPSVASVRASLAAGWPMVSASYLPVVTLLLARVAGASAYVAALLALIVTIILLVLHAHAAGRAAGLAGKRLLVVTSMAGLLGLGMIALKTFLHYYHH